MKAKENFLYPKGERNGKNPQDEWKNVEPEKHMKWKKHVYLVMMTERDHNGDG